MRALMQIKPAARTDRLDKMPCICPIYAERGSHCGVKLSAEYAQETSHARLSSSLLGQRKRRGHG